MSDTHIRRKLDGALGAVHSDSFALLATAKIVDTAVIFVHGFGGSPGGTFSQFELIDRLAFGSELWKNTDLFFYGYKSVRNPLLFSAADFTRFLKIIFPTPPDALFVRQQPSSLSSLQLTCPPAVRAGFTGYLRLVLVAHSEGAAVVRRSLCDLGIEFAEAHQLAMNPNYRSIDITDTEGAVPVARGGRATPVQTTSTAQLDVMSSRVKEQAIVLLARPNFRALTASLKLFAPAHCGSLITGRLGLLTALFRDLYEVVRNTSVAASELEKPGAVIGSLKTETEDLGATYPYLDAFRADILWGSKEHVVDVQKFRYDRYDVLQGHDHWSICKPNLSFLTPIKFVEGQLHAGSATV